MNGNFEKDWFDVILKMTEDSRKMSYAVWRVSPMKILPVILETYLFNPGQVYVSVDSSQLSSYLGLENT